MSGATPEISIIIKALNEERHIAGAIESALAALAGFDGEVILADSASTDRTVEIAAAYPIKIVRLNRIGDRSCGVGVQLGYQYASGRFICLIDGDMRLYERFLPAALRFLKEHEQFAGVGGIIVEREAENLEYVKRASARDADRQPGIVDQLDCGGLYRRGALEAVGYFGDRNLHSREELELGVRLRARGWKLARIELPAIDHYGHTGNAYSLLLRRWQTRNAFGTGEVLRASVGRSSFWLAIRKMQRELCLLSAVHVWWFTLIAAPLLIGTSFHGMVAATSLALLPFALMALRCRSLRLGVYSVTAWNVYAAGIWPGLLCARVDPAGWIDSTIVREGKPTDSVQPRPSSTKALKDLVTGSGAEPAGGRQVTTASAPAR
jgi:glycosyltransferase involved in cell wall biosynthesis